MYESGPSSNYSTEQAAQYADEQQHIVDGHPPRRTDRNIKKTLVANDQQCLVQRGYSKFALTDDQRHALRKLKAGSDGGAHYLYDLASNPACCRHQRLPRSPCCREPQGLAGWPPAGLDQPPRSADPCTRYGLR